MQEAYANWRAAPFPHGSDNDETDELHADLVLADHWVAESVIPFVRSREFEPPPFDVLAELRVMRERAAVLPDAGKSTQYLTYLGLLVDVYEAYLREGARAGGESPT